MLKAIAAMKSGQFSSAEAAAHHFDVPASTFRHRINGRVSRQESRGEQQKLTPAQEKELIRWITQLSITGYSPRHDMVREMAEAIQEKSMGNFDTSNIIDPNDSRSGFLGHDWVHNFIQRHPELKTVVGKTIDNVRVKETTVDALKVWFDAYNREVIQDEDVLFKNVYNADESGFSIGTIQASRVIINSAVDSQFQVQPGRQEWVTVMECICADGTSISPLIIFKGESLSSSWVPSSVVPKDWLFSNNSKGWTSNDHGLNWLQNCFEPRTREKANGRLRVFICDGHGSHVTGKFIKHCMNRNIKLLILLPYSSYVTQPLDIGLFSPLKKYLSAEIAKIVGTNIACLAKSEWCTDYVKARASAFTIHNIRSSWDGAGLYPFQPRKVIQRIRGSDIPPLTLTPPPTDIFETTLLYSSPSDAVSMHEANKALYKLLNSSSSLNSS